MPKDLSTLFKTEIRKRKRKRHRQLRLRLFVIVLLSIVGIIPAYWLLLFSLHASKNFLIMAGLIAIALLIVFCWQKQPKFIVPWFFKSLSFNKLIRYLSFLIFLILIIDRSYPEFLSIPLRNFSANVIYSPSPQNQASRWPWKTELMPHPAIMTISSEAEQSIASVAKYIVQQEDEPEQQIKAIHDYVLHRLTYDKDVLTTGKRPPQNAQAVFTSGKAVCEGYAKLFQAISRAAGLNVVYLIGKVRRDLVPSAVISNPIHVLYPQYDWTLHAWNAVELNDSWYLVDTTWDDGNTYDTSYLMLPPEVMIISHLPELPVWQLLDKPIDTEGFSKSPLVQPAFFAEKLRLLSPTNYQTEVTTTANIDIGSPEHYPNRLVAFSTPKLEDVSAEDWQVFQPELSQKSARKQNRCDTQQRPGNLIHISCSLPSSGNHEVFLFSEGKQTVRFLGKFIFSAS